MKELISCSLVIGEGRWRKSPENEKGVGNLKMVPESETLPYSTILSWDSLQLCFNNLITVEIQESPNVYWP